jgi:hypothetical protein
MVASEVAEEYFSLLYVGLRPDLHQQVVLPSEDGSRGGEVRGLFDTVWVTGKLRAVGRSTPMAQMGYTIKALRVEPSE